MSHIPIFSGEQITIFRRFRAVLQDYDFSAQAGAIVWLAGRNGAGKTTLLRIMTGLLRPHSGAVKWGQENIREEDIAHRARLMFLSHLAPIYPELNALENLRWRSPQVDTDQMLGMLSHYKMQTMAEIPLRYLSAGQQRRVALAAIMLERDKPLWLLDEPFIYLDQEAQITLQEQIKLRQEKGLITIVASHQPLSLIQPTVWDLDKTNPGLHGELVEPWPQTW